MNFFNIFKSQTFSKTSGLFSCGNHKNVAIIRECNCLNEVRGEIKNSCISFERIVQADIVYRASTNYGVR